MFHNIFSFPFPSFLLSTLTFLFVLPPLLLSLSFVPSVLNTFFLPPPSSPFFQLSPPKKDRVSHRSATDPLVTILLFPRTGNLP